MLLSKYFLPVLKEQPIEAQIASHSLMLRSGMIRQQVSGIYSWLPLGLKVLKNIEKIVRINMDAIDCIELLMPCVQPASLWEESGRMEAYGKEMLKFKDRHDNTLLFGPTAEELVTDIFRSNIKSYKDLPKNFYNIQWKFRDEIRPRFGVMRAREFLMKDGYSFDIDQDSAIRTYKQMYVAYIKTFQDLGLTVVPVSADSGAIGGDMSHEFHILADTGESTIYYDKKFEILSEDLPSNIEMLQNLYAASDEKHDPATCHVPEKELAVSRSIEVGHIFYFGDKYSKSMNVTIQDSAGNLVLPEMSCYGIGISRLVAAIIEANHDEKGIVWPVSVAPFKVSIINLNVKDSKCCELANILYNNLIGLGIDTLYDDTQERPGVKFATHDLIGSPWQLVIGPKKAQDGLIELKHRETGESDTMTLEVALETLVGNLNLGD